SGTARRQPGLGDRRLRGLCKPAGAGQQLKRLDGRHDGGRSWKLRADDHRVPSSGYLASIAFTDDHKGLMTTNRGGLLATEDGGRSWRMLLLTDDATDVVAMQRLG